MTMEEVYLDHDREKESYRQNCIIIFIADTVVFKTNIIA